MRKPGRAFHRHQSRRYAWPDITRQRSGRNASPWYLKSYGSRPTSKLKPALPDVA